MRAAGSIIILLLTACATDPAGPECEQPALESWPYIVRHEDPDYSEIVQDTTALACTVGEVVVQGDLAVGTCVCID